MQIYDDDNGKAVIVFREYLCEVFLDGNKGEIKWFSIKMNTQPTN